jgi:hypothetical protein
MSLIEKMDATAMATNGDGDHEPRTRGGSEEPVRTAAASARPVCAVRAAGGGRRPLAPSGDTPAQSRHPGFLPGFLASVVVSACLGVLLWTRVNHNI